MLHFAYFQWLQQWSVVAILKGTNILVVLPPAELWKIFSFPRYWHLKLTWIFGTFLLHERMTSSFFSPKTKNPGQLNMASRKRKELPELCCDKTTDILVPFQNIIFWGNEQLSPVLSQKFLTQPIIKYWVPTSTGRLHSKTNNLFRDIVSTKA